MGHPVGSMVGCCASHCAALRSRGQAELVLGQTVLELLDEGVDLGGPGAVALAAQGFGPEECAAGGVGAGRVDAEGRQRVILRAVADARGVHGDEQKGQVSGLGSGLALGCRGHGFAEGLYQLPKLGGGGAVHGLGFYGYRLRVVERLTEFLPVAGVDVLPQGATAGTAVLRVHGGKRSHKESQRSEEQASVAEFSRGTDPRSIDEELRTRHRW